MRTSKKQQTELSSEGGTLVNSVIKALHILEGFTLSQQELTLSQISRQQGLPKSTALNLIRTLEASGYLLHTSNSQTYRLGYKVMELSYHLRSSMPIIQVATPFLEELQIKTEENIYLTSHLDGQVFYLKGLHPSIRIGNYSVAGKRLPMHCTGCGKAMLAYLPEEELEAVIQRWGLPAITKNTITSRQRLDKDLELTRSRGYALDREEETLGVRCIAMPILDGSGYPAGAISISGTTISIRDELLNDYAKMLSRVCNVLASNASWLPAAQVRQENLSAGRS